MNEFFISFLSIKAKFRRSIFLHFKTSTCQRLAGAPVAARQKPYEISPHSTAELGKHFGVNSPLLFQAPNEEYSLCCQGL